ncbi:MAG: DNA mismatch repair protein MutS [Clostridia bacterium]|nr:DNA mismatch repair protein MutS [Clostridia bacterium]
MMQHYLETKENYKDCVLFYRLGDFYEMFFEDAIKVSKMLDLTLTGRDCGREERAPMCGIPFHAADNYIAKLVSLGEKVAICEQVEDPANAKGIVERRVVKIVSAGTITENSLLDDKVNNFLSSVALDNDTFSVSWVDITTGEFLVQALKPGADVSQVIDLLTRISPAEIICNQEVYKLLKSQNAVSRGGFYLNLYKEWSFNPTHAEKSLKEHFGVLSLDSYGITGNLPAISSSGALIEYLKETQQHGLINVNTLRLIENGKNLLLDASAIRNLELIKSMRDGKRYGTLLWVLDSTKTPMGSRLLNNWILNPLISKEKINYRLNGVEELYKNALIRNALTDILDCVRDTERLSGKISNGNITPKDAYILSESLSVLPSLTFALSGASSTALNDVMKNIFDFSEVTSLINLAIDKDISQNALKDGGFIRDGFDRELDRLRSLYSNSKEILDEMEERERNATGIKNLKIDYNRVFGYYIEVTNSFKDKVPYSYVRKQTLVNAERYITEELKNLEEELLTSKEKAYKLELEIFNKIKNVLAEHIVEIQKSSKAVAFLDCLYSLATVAKKNSYVKPVISDRGTKLSILGGRHPVVEKVSSSQFIPNDTNMCSSSDRMMIITGPNMAGKSTYMRQVALITIMAHIGSFVPAKSAEIPITDKIFTRVGASDNLILDQSTFMVEMNEVATILNKATKDSLIILDEVGRGTSTYDGLSIAWAVVEYVTSVIKANTLFATHYHELSELEGKLEGVKNYKILVKEYNGTVIFLRKIQEGSANKSFGIEVASLAGVPKEVTTRAKSILKELENKDLNRPQNQALEVSDKPDNNALNELLSADLDAMSPRDALDFLYYLKSKIGE